MPTKVYRYGLLTPTAGAELIDQQMDLAGRSAAARMRAYHDYCDARDDIYAHYAAAHTEMAALEGQIQMLRKALRADKRQTDLKATIHALRQRLREVRQRANTERAAVRAQGKLATLDAALKAEYLRLARLFTNAGLFWGQRQLVEAAHDQRVKTSRGQKPPVRTGFHAVGIQIAGGIAPAALAMDPRCSITDAQPVPGRMGQPRPRLRLRIGPHNGIAEWPIILHRDIPPDASIRFVKVTRRQVGFHTQWEAHLTVTIPDIIAPDDDGTAVAVKPRFRYDEATSALVAADACGSDGQRSVYAVSSEVVDGIRLVCTLQSIRDRNRDAFLPALVAWMAETKPPHFPSTIARWESCNRLRAFVQGYWATHRLAGDESIFAQASAWARQDAHLWTWAANQRQKVLARRTHEYREWAARLAARYSTVVVDTVNYAHLAMRHARPEADSVLHKRASQQRMLAAPGMLRAAVVQAFQARGKRVVEVDPSDVETMLRERAGGREKTVGVRRAKFATRHRSSMAQASASAAHEPPLA